MESVFVVFSPGHLQEVLVMLVWGRFQPVCACVMVAAPDVLLGDLFSWVFGS